MSGCGATCGIQRERERERHAALAAAARAYPDLVWQPGADTDIGFSPDAIVALGRELEDLLPVRAIFRPADGAVGGCDFLYLLAGLHTPALVELVDGGNDVDRVEPARTDETYVRLAFSRLGPFVTLQEVNVWAEREDGAWLVVESPRMGVEDRRLQAIVKGLQGKLRKAKLVVLDMAFLAQPVADVAGVAASEANALAQDAYTDAFGEAPSVYALLFAGTPAAATRASTL